MQFYIQISQTQTEALIQISVRDMKNYIILPVSQVAFHDATNQDDILCIGDTSLRKYTQKRIKPTET